LSCDARLEELLLENIKLIKLKSSKAWNNIWKYDNFTRRPAILVSFRPVAKWQKYGRYVPGDSRK